MSKMLLRVSVLAMTAALGACGGGGATGGGPAPVTSPSPAPSVPSPSTPAPAPSTPAPSTPAPSTPAPSTPAPSSFDTTQYRASAAAGINAIEAYKLGAFGQNVKLGIVDAGVAHPNNIFGNRLKADPGFSQTAGVDNAPDSHGTRIASIAGASMGGTAGMHGVAPKAQIFGYDASSGSNGDIGSGSAARAIDSAVNAGVDAIGMSFGSNRVAGERFDVDGIFQLSIANAAKAGVVFVVAAGNDSRSEVSTLAAFPLYFEKQFEGVDGFSENPLNGRFIAGVALDSSGNKLASFSNACGMAKNFCLSAVGSRLVSVDKNGKTGSAGGGDLASGTSFVAPQILGAFAVIKSLWPTLSEKDIVEILLRSADDIGTPGIDEVFGYGRLNLANAVNPQGNLKLPAANYDTKLNPDGSRVLGSAGVDISGSIMVASSAMGGALRSMAAAGPSLAVFDAFGRGYKIDMAQFATEARKRLDYNAAFSDMTSTRDMIIETAPGVTMRFSADPHGAVATNSSSTRFKVNGMTLGVAQNGRSSDIPGVASFRGVGGKTAGVIDVSRLENPYLALLNNDTYSVGDTVSPGNGMEVGVFWANGDTENGNNGQAYGVTAGWSDGVYNLYGTAGVVEEESGMLGAGGRGVFSFGDSQTEFVSIAGKVSLGYGWALTADAHAGQTKMKSGSGLVSGGEATSTSWNIGGEKSGVLMKDDTLSFSVGQPLSVNNGSISMRVPTGGANFQNTNGDLKTKREFALRMGWEGNISNQETLTLGTILRLNADGEKDQTEAGAALVYQRNF